MSGPGRTSTGWKYSRRNAARSHTDRSLPDSWPVCYFHDVSAPNGKGRGRRTKFTEVRKEVVLKALRFGNTRQCAYGLAKVSHDTFYNHLKKDLQFSEAVAKAEADAEDTMARVVIAAAAKGTWQAAAWWLERRRPHDYRQRHDVMMEHAGGVKHEGKVKLEIGNARIEQVVDILQGVGVLARPNGKDLSS